MEVAHSDMAVKTLVEGLIQAVATGTFLYIAFVEIVTPELNKPDLPPLLKVCVTDGVTVCVRVFATASAENDCLDVLLTILKILF